MSPTEQPDSSPSTNITEGETPSIGGAPLEPAVGERTGPDLSEPSSTTSAPPAKAKTKGVADIVFMLDITGSMAPCIDALRANIETFIDSLSKGEANNAPPIRDWRAKVVGYRDVEAAQSEGIPWFVDAPFVRDAGELKAQLSQLRAEGGGDEPESLLDALFKIASMEASPKGAQAIDADK